jgi:GTP-binding protein
LRHIERTQVLIHLIDAIADDPTASYHTIQTELQEYGHGLPDKPQIVALNKIDALSEVAIAELVSQFPTPPLLVSATAKIGLDNLLQAVWQMLEQPEIYSGTCHKSPPPVT